MDALADALRIAGVDPDRVAHILGSAAEATMHALALDEHPQFATGAAAEAEHPGPLRTRRPSGSRPDFAPGRKDCDYAGASFGVFVRLVPVFLACDSA